MNVNLPNLKAWLAEPMPKDVARAVERLARSPDVRHVAVMPDVHLARDVCVGTAVATSELIYPAAVGTDIGCGIAAVAFDTASQVVDERVAVELLSRLPARVPVNRQPDRSLPTDLLAATLSDPNLDRVRMRDGSVQFGTLGRGNHFLEFQRDEEGRLWLMVHSGSRAMGRAIREFHETRIPGGGNKLKAIPADTPEGEAYLTDLHWARSYAKASRRCMIDRAARVLSELTGVEFDPDSYFDCDHNHVRRETHLGSEFWVHRKGAVSAGMGEVGSIPGSMGTVSFHVSGRGEQLSLRSSSHGAGRAMSRDQARRRVRSFDLLQKMEGIYFDMKLTAALREESPQAYKDVTKVLRAEAELTRIVRRLKPIVVYKGA
jgi:tRNA-splicing ligase RtcB (3'-phosphate/5'-hydroxy nucleic acid ligase)